MQDADLSMNLYIKNYTTIPGRNGNPQITYPLGYSFRQKKNI